MDYNTAKFGFELKALKMDMNPVQGVFKRGVSSSHSQEDIEIM
jgi:hypothetical protein